MGDRAASPSGDGEDRWVLRAADLALIGNRAGAMRPSGSAFADPAPLWERITGGDGFAGLLKLFAMEGCFPRRPEGTPAAVVEAVAGQVGAPAAAWQRHHWCGSAIEYHRVQVCAAFGFRPMCGYEVRLEVSGTMIHVSMGAPMHRRLAHPAI